MSEFNQMQSPSPKVESNVAAKRSNLLDESLPLVDDLYTLLASDPRTASSIIEVIYERGVLTLAGVVEHESIHAAAEEIVKGHEGVLSVVNALEVRPKEGVGIAVTPTRLMLY